MNAALLFGGILAGAVVIKYGVGNVHAAVSSSSSSTSSTPAVSSSTSATGRVTSADLQAPGQQYGWTGAELDAWMRLISRESGGNPNAVNKSSRASLIGQFLPMNWGKYGPGSDPAQHPSIAQQLDSMALYIHDRYGSPSAAWAHETANGWY